MEQSASRTASARHRTGGISTATENVFVYVRHRRLVTFVFDRLINIRLLLLLLQIFQRHFCRFAPHVKERFSSTLVDGEGTHCLFPNPCCHPFELPVSHVHANCGVVLSDVININVITTTDISQIVILTDAVSMKAVHLYRVFCFVALLTEKAGMGSGCAEASKRRGRASARGGGRRRGRRRVDIFNVHCIVQTMLHCHLSTL